MNVPCELTPAGWAPPRGYAHGVIASGRVVALAGQIGWVPESCTFETTNFAGQVRQCLTNVARLLTEAGATPGHLVRLTWYITDRAAYLENQKAIGAAYREVMGLHFPPMSVVVVSALLEEHAMVEIEATAVIPA